MSTPRKLGDGFRYLADEFAEPKSSEGLIAAAASIDMLDSALEEFRRELPESQVPAAHELIRTVRESVARLEKIAFQSFDATMPTPEEKAGEVKRRVDEVAEMDCDRLAHELEEHVRLGCRWKYVPVSNRAAMFLRAFAEWYRKGGKQDGGESHQ